MFNRYAVKMSCGLIFYNTLSPTANKMYVPHDLNESDEEIQG
jgi:hypothetical protein